MACPNFVCFHIRSVNPTWETVETVIANWNLSSRFESKEHEPQDGANGGSKGE